MNKMAWDLTSEYPSFDSPEFNSEFSGVQTRIQAVREKLGAMRGSFEDHLAVVQDTLIERIQLHTLLQNMSSFLRLQLNVDSSLEAVSARASELDQMYSSFVQDLVPLENFLIKTSEEFLLRVLENPELSSSKFYWQERRKLKDHALADGEESLLQALQGPGLNAWGELYSKLSGSMRCDLKFTDKVETVGLAHASALIRNPDEETRKVAWTSIQEAWTVYKEPAAAILNSLAGWRLEEGKKRSHFKKQSFLDVSLHQSRIKKETLEALLTACYDNVESSRRAPMAMAKLLKKDKLDPWDLLAQCPVSSSPEPKTFDEALQIIESAFSEVDPEMGSFVRMMADNNWIEGRILPNKKNGAFCSGFRKSRTPRVFMTFMGSNNDISTLAHELGHAYHNWVMRDLPVAEINYPMTLAETASIFSETLLQDVLFANAKTKEEKIEFAWSDVESATAFLLNIPSRFDFENDFYKKRESRSLSAAELSQLTDQAWTKWYGSTLTKNDDMYWATKLHFSIASTRFYNFPYTFGYLFGLSIYSRRQQLGSNFMKIYKDLLRDTGRMTAEECVKKHLGEDITKPEFWKNSIQTVNKKVALFEDLIR